VYTIIVFLALLVVNCLLAGATIHARNYGPRWVELFFTIVYGLLNLMSLALYMRLIKIDFAGTGDELSLAVGFAMSLGSIAISCATGIVISKTLKPKQ
jgi:cytochrome bd-type quinol oxidase subunit 2